MEAQPLQPISIIPHPVINLNNREKDEGGS